MQLYNGDCLEIMNNIKTASIDMILTDMPFGVTASEWDVQLPLEEVWQHYNRIIKDNGAIVLFGQEPFSSKLRLSNIKYFKYDWVWKKPKGTGHLNAKKQPMRDVEIISVFYKKQCTYNPQFTKGEPYKNKSSSKPNLSKTTCYGKNYDDNAHRNDNTGFRYPKQVIEFGVVERGNLHVNEKPIELLEYMIRTYTHKGEVVLDSCMGSGSTGVACINTQRDFIGIELNCDYYKIAKKRIEDMQHDILDV